MAVFQTFPTGGGGVVRGMFEKAAGMLPAKCSQAAVGRQFGTARRAGRRAGRAGLIFHVGGGRRGGGSELRRAGAYLTVVMPFRLLTWAAGPGLIMSYPVMRLVQFGCKLSPYSCFSCTT